MDGDWRMKEPQLMDLLTDDVDVKLWCCREALKACVAKSEPMQPDSLATVLAGLDAGANELQRLRAVIGELWELVVLARNSKDEEALADAINLSASAIACKDI